MQGIGETERNIRALFRGGVKGGGRSKREIGTKAEKCDDSLKSLLTFIF